MPSTRKQGYAYQVLSRPTLGRGISNSGIGYGEFNIADDFPIF